MHAGLSNLVVLKTKHSGFAGFIREPFTTLPETSDRIFATAVNAQWLYANEALDYDALWTRVRQLLVDTFAAHLPVDLTPLGLENRNEIFMPVDEPHGLIEATLRRGA